MFALSVFIQQKKITICLKLIFCEVGRVLVQETPDGGGPHKAVFPILLGEASIIQLSFKCGTRGGQARFSSHAVDDADFPEG